MCKRILLLTFLLLSIPTKSTFAKNTPNIEANESKKEADNDFMDSSLETETYQVKPQFYISFYPRYGINFLRVSGDKNLKENKTEWNKRDKEDFDVFRSRNLGVTLAINLPIKFYHFFYSIGFDFTHRTLTWKNFKNLHSQSLFVGKIDTNNDEEKYSKFFQDDLKKDVGFTSLNFFDFSALLGFGLKSDIYDHRNGFFLKGMLGVGFQFGEEVDMKKKDFLLSSKALNNIPIRNVKFLWGVEAGYWRVGLNLMGDFVPTLKSNVGYTGEDLDVSRFFSPISLTIFFDLV